MAGEDEWEAARQDVQSHFSPGAPIRLAEELAGRNDETQRLRGIVLSAGEHALVYGERGVGKTSIANTFYLGLNSPTRTCHLVHVNCGESDYSAIWKKVFRRIRVAEGAEYRTLDAIYTGEITPDDVEIELSNFRLVDMPIICLDEFDKVQDERTKRLMAETIKSLSDHALHTKIVLVGIAKNATELLEHHGSISRALRQVSIARLSLNELETIIVSRYKRCGLSITDDALFQMAYLARGLPYYAHLLGRHTALDAIDRKTRKIRVEHLLGGLSEAVRNVDQTITERYLSSVRNQRGDETLYEPVLLACALADADELGRFQQAAVQAPLSEIIVRDKPYTATTFAFHMNEFCTPKRNEILERDGPERNLRYTFSDAMMQPYVIIRSLQNGVLKRETFDKFSARRQKAFSI